jgi:hypothetical protein
LFVAGGVSGKEETMLAFNTIAFFFDVVISVGIVLALYTLLGKSLQELLDKVIRLPAASVFYMRALILVLLCGALSKVLSGIHQKPDDHFIEYVWAVARDISNVFDNLFVILLIYVAIVTVLVVVLKPKNE